MSAGAVGVLAPAHVRISSRATRPPLRLVASDGGLSPHGRLGRGERVPAQELPAFRLTRRGRLVITLMATLAVTTLALMLATTVDAVAPQIDHATTVLAGQTLSEVAARQLPSLSIQNAVARIQLANDLNSLQVHAGQSLLIPALP
jgi:hypothetical protein